MAEVSLRYCTNCRVSLEEEQRYCPECGKFSGVQKDENFDDNFKKKLTGIGIFYFAQVIVCLVAAYADVFETYPAKFFINGIFLLLTLIFFLGNYKYLLPLLFFKRVKLKLVLLLVPLAIIASLLVSYSVDFLNGVLFHENYTYVYSFPGFNYTLVWLILVDALFPALDEEIGFRGILFNQLKSFLKPRQIMWVTAILFTTIHLSVFSIFWIIPFGYLTAYLRQKHQTLWYGIVIHFFFNTTAVILDYYQNYS